MSSGATARAVETPPTGGSSPVSSHAVSPREAFLCALFNGPLLPADAVVVLEGDGKKRLDSAVGILRQRAANWAVVTGEVEGAHGMTSGEAARYLIERGLSPERIVQVGGLNTHEECERVSDWLEVVERERDTVLLVTSPYHMPRAFLTMLASLQERGLDETIVVLPLPAGDTPWWEAPDGIDVTRMDLLADEFRKIEAYQALGHVASYEDGLAYLREWEATGDAG